MRTRVPGSGFAGVGRGAGRVRSAADFRVATPDGVATVLEVAGRGSYHREFGDDPGRSEYFVPVRWLQIVPLERAVDEVGLFGNPQYRLQAHDAEVAIDRGALEGKVPGLRFGRRLTRRKCENASPRGISGRHVSRRGPRVSDSCEPSGTAESSRSWPDSQNR